MTAREFIEDGVRWGKIERKLSEDGLHGWALNDAMESRGYCYLWELNIPEFAAGMMVGREGGTWDFPEVTGWRYGDIPINGKSTNYRDECCERGVSLVQIDGEDETKSFATLGAAGRPKVRVRGYLLPWRGSDGEPLVTGAQKIK